MSYTPKTEEQLIREGLMPDGIYDFQVVETSNKPAKSGKPMLTLKLHVFDEEMNPRIIQDYISLGSNYGERKFRHAADACQLLEAYASGTLLDNHHEFMDKTGRVNVKTQEGTAEYPNPKNIVQDYVKREAMAANEPLRGKQPPSGLLGEGQPLDDEIPF